MIIITLFSYLNSYIYQIKKYNINLWPDFWKNSTSSIFFKLWPPFFIPSHACAMSTIILTKQLTWNHWFILSQLIELTRSSVGIVRLCSIGPWWEQRSFSLAFMVIVDLSVWQQRRVWICSGEVVCDTSWWFVCTVDLCGGAVVVGRRGVHVVVVGGMVVCCLWWWDGVTYGGVRGGGMERSGMWWKAFVIYYLNDCK